MGWGYPPIVGSGPNTNILHYEKSNRRMEAGELLLVDAAANYEYLTGDITRTYPVSGTFSPLQKDIYRIVLAAQEEGMKIAKPGVKLSDIHQKTVQVVKDGLLKLGLISDTSGDQYRTWYTHGACHFIGMDVHDVGDYDRPLELGMNICLETPVGLVGLGNMGSGVADNLLKKGFHLTVHERSEKARRWAKGRSGVVLTPSLRELGSLSKIVLILVTDNQALDEVLYATEGLLAGIRPGSLVIDMTTGDPTLAVENHRRLAEMGVRMLEAPMTGGATGAREGALLLMVGGDRKLCRDCQPLFSAIARKVVYAGGPGKGPNHQAAAKSTLFFAFPFHLRGSL